MPNLPQITLSELLGTMNLLLNAGLNASQYTSLQILTDWINQNWSNVENLPPLQITDLSVMPPVRKYVTYNILGKAFAALNINFTVAQEAALESHIQDYTNPHNVTAAQVGLNFLENLGITTQSDIGASPPSDTYVTFDILTAAMDSFGLGVLRTLTLVPNYPPFNPSTSTNGQGDTLITYSTLQAALFSTQTFNNGNVLTSQQIQQLQAHLLNYSNPHKVTATQVGLGSIGNYPPTYISDVQAVAAGGQPPVAYITYNILSQAAGTLYGSLTATQIQSLIDHLTNYNNPHTVNGPQVALNNVANLSPVTTADITAVTAGGTPPDKYITYNELANANRSLNFHTGFGLSLKVTATNITNTAMTFNAIISNIYNFNLTDTQVTFTYHPAGNPSALITLAPIPYSSSLTISVTEPLLSPSTSYTIGAQLTSTVDANFQINAASIHVSTLASSTSSSSTSSAPAPVNSTPPALQTGDFFFNIVGSGASSSTTELDSSTVNAPGCTFNNYQCIDSGSGGQHAVTYPIGDPSGAANFTSVSAQLSFIPSSFIKVLTGSTANKVYISESAYSGLGTGGVVSFLANGNVDNYTIGTNCSLNYKAAYSVTTPGSSYVVPATTTQTAAAYSYTVPASIGTYATYTLNLYSDESGFGNYAFYYTVSGNTLTFYEYSDVLSGSSTVYTVTTVSVSSSGVTNISTSTVNSMPGNAIQANNGDMVTPQMTNFVASFVQLMYQPLALSVATYTPATTVNVPATYSTTPSYTVTNPSTTVNYPAAWWISLNNALPNTPSTAWNGNQRAPVGCISASSYVSTGTNLGVASNSTGSKVYLTAPLPSGITAGAVLEFIVNGSPVQLTLGTGVSYNTIAAYSVTTPGTSYVVPATTTQTAPASSYTVPANPYAVVGSLYGDNNLSGDYANYWSGPNATGSVVCSVYGSITNGYANYYSGPNGTGTLIGSAAGNHDINGDYTNYYSGPNATGTLVGSVYGDNNLNGDYANYWSGANASGSVVGSIYGSITNGYANYWSGPNATGSVVGSADGNNAIAGDYTNYYSGPNATGSIGMPVNQFMLPFQFGDYAPATTVNVPATYNTTAAYTVTNPPVTTNYPEQYYLEPSSPLAAAPSAVYTTTPQDSYKLAPLTVSTITYNSGVVTFTLDPFTGNGRHLEVGFSALYAGDTVVEFKGSVVQG
jgi:hypothetical protein